MPDAGWKQFERRAAAFFGALRRPLSGNRSGRADLDGGDATHERMFIEAKLRTSHGVYRIWDKARAEAKGKPVVLCLQERNRPGFLVAAHCYDFADVVVEWLASRDADVLIQVEHRVRTRRAEIDGAGADAT